jgi:hypothetical protein
MLGYVIPAEEVRLFLEDIGDETYDGKPNLVGFFQTVENPTLRQRLGLEATDGGLMVRDPIDDAEDYPLKPWDVITHVGGHALDKKGNVRLEDGLNISFRYLLTDLVKENLLPVTILREGEAQDLQLRRGSLALPRLLAPLKCAASSQGKTRASCRARGGKSALLDSSLLVLT